MVSAQRPHPTLAAYALVSLDPPGLAPGGADPLFYRGMRDRRVDVRARPVVERHAVGAEARRDRSEHRVGEAVAAEEEWPVSAVSAAAIAPERDDARDVGLHVGGHG